MIIKYNIFESILGIDYITPCPHNQKGRYTNEIIKVGGMACCRCHYYMGKDIDSVKCKFKMKDVSVLPKEKEAIFVHKKGW